MGRGKLTPQDREQMPIIAANINRLLTEQNKKQIDLSRGTGIPASTLTGYVKGTSLPVAGNVQKIADFFGVKKSDIDPRFGTSTAPQNELLTTITDKVVELDQKLKEPRHGAWINHGEALLEEQIAEQQAEEKEKAKIIVLPQPEESYVEEDEELCSYRFIDQPASAGRGAYLLDDTEEETVELPVDINADFVVPVDGDSMEPDYHDGDYIFIKQALYLYDGDIGLFIYNGEGYVKQLIKKGRHHYLHSLNPEYKDMLITEDNDLRIIGKVVGRYRED